MLKAGYGVEERGGNILALRTLKDKAMEKKMLLIGIVNTYKVVFVCHFVFAFVCLF